MPKPLHKLIDESLLEDLRRAYVYDPKTGLWRFGYTRGRWKKGELAGSMDAAGYRKISFKGKAYAATRLAWLYMTGKSPPVDRDIDHINRVRGDDRWCNLRLATRKQNNNNKGKRTHIKFWDIQLKPNYYELDTKLPRFLDHGVRDSFEKEFKDLLAPLMMKYGNIYGLSDGLFPIIGRSRKSPPLGLWEDAPGFHETNMVHLLN